MAVPLFDIKRELVPIKTKLEQAVISVLDHGRFILGPEVAQLETEIAQLCGVDHAIGVASGTDALMLALHACGVGPGDEVITTAFSFFASAGVISRLGAKPVFVDIDPATFNLDPERLEAAITSQTKAIMPVHLFGQTADMNRISKIASQHGLKVVEDGAQAIGSLYHDRPAGALGDVGCFSFFPTKNLGAAGDAGMIVTNDPTLAEMVRLLRVHGGHFEYHHKLVGYNSRLDSMQAAVLLVKLPHLKSWTEGRRHNALRYDNELAGLPLATPAIGTGNYHIYNQYTITTDRRDDLLKYLSDKNIGCKVYYPVPFHLQECFADLGYSEGQLPHCEKASQSVLSLPVFGAMTDDEQTEVISAIKQFFT